MSSINDGFPNQKPVYQRWNIHHRLVHLGIYVGFIICALTGLPIKFHYKAWAMSLSIFFGGGDSLLGWHIFGGMVCFAAAFYHLGFLAVYGPIKGQWSSAIWFLTKTTGQGVVENFKYMTGMSDKPARFDRYSYKEMLDYWAVFWGMAIIGISGLMMWMPEWTMQYFPRWILDSYRMGHSDEAVLAVLVIFIWHFYNVHFSPDFFPMSWTWWDGNMTYELMKHEHPIELERIMAKQGQANQKPSSGVGPGVNTPGSG